MSSNAKKNRKNPRYRRDEKLFAQITASIFQPENEGSTLAGKTLDISRRGMRISTHDSIPVGCMVDLWVNMVGMRGKFYLNSEVKWSRIDDRVGYVMGVELREGVGSDIGNWERLFAKKSSTEVPRTLTEDVWGNEAL